MSRSSPLLDIDKGLPNVCWNLLRDKFMNAKEGLCGPTGKIAFQLSAAGLLQPSIANGHAPQAAWNCFGSSGMGRMSDGRGLSNLDWGPLHASHCRVNPVVPQLFDDLSIRDNIEVVRDLDGVSFEDGVVLQGHKCRWKKNMPKLTMPGVASGFGELVDLHAADDCSGGYRNTFIILLRMILKPKIAALLSSWLFNYLRSNRFAILFGI